MSPGTRATLIGCNGRVTHELEVRSDGRVQVRSGSMTSVVDTVSGRIHPPGYRLPEDVLAAARTLAAC